MKESNKVIKADHALTTEYAVKKAYKSIVEQGRQIQLVAQNVDENFSKAVELIIGCSGRLIISGMGKSGIIGKKIAATMASTGTASFFIHPGEAFHGDLGMIQPEDIILLITNSGETDEVLKLIPSLKQFGNKIIAMTGAPQSTLAKNADITINVKIEKEVCPNNLAPTTSTTATLVMGDALAIALIYLRDFQPHQFALYHPGGSLGKKLLTKVADVMHTKNLPFVMPDDTMHDVILTMTNSTLGLAIVQNNGLLEGIITDGDLRRSLMQYSDYKVLTATDMMTIIPITISQDHMLAEAEEIMRENHIKNVLVVDDNDSNTVVGVLEYFQS
ncbi:KpsF/GutQ family sugar-phosphate isomerase [Colwellia sp. 1_MG-2023]|jgi:arabinose-5-phosphate isomerase|uniref:KpsF/GutQ family sugar-phosphate isomerase n=1 Tax=unclassified Colwellia TaxID=196834 RepID=UPI001C09BC60|nr:MULTISPECIES: KpsF/GutQ family sugar-phosphate isomerase [unclassified Colwellia]MBU2925640.1 KpsF/GutQ family sugar-phosphate isomerase [Colwellia sp. C2M11]MDO6489363.1 KpsF/GutQ family sugar-phosphate isomerase [Colwellia sp. 6_MG-2023]MDO6651134.1 KpsF/GutQ family sugar-phosphate isomerase [Colwellia sp. 3_MG-2023]MDO6666428.1 KpsF/GutQ family sugar-phosphate isomerase [Colwellia sp. 2_MG-2023]MDO6690722.1 KpsF/GutQ family sugar-phosphate isomerase [Colwellia sp. 1_MG-2023]